MNIREKILKRMIEKKLQLMSRLQLAQTEHIIYSFSHEQQNTFIENIWSAQTRKSVSYKTKITFGITKDLNKTFRRHFDGLAR